MDLGLSLFILVTFVAIVLLVEGAYLLWSDYKGPEVQRLEKRLRSLSAGRHGTEIGSLLKQRSGICSASPGQPSRRPMNSLLSATRSSGWLTRSETFESPSFVATARLTARA